MNRILKLMQTLGIAFALHPVALFFAVLAAWTFLMAIGVGIIMLAARVF